MPLTPAVLARNAAVAPCRLALRRVAMESDLFADAICKCANPDCRNRTGAGITITRFLDVMADAWVKEATSAEGTEHQWTPASHDSPIVHRIPRAVQANLRDALVALGDAASLWETLVCDCDHPRCLLRAPREAAVGDLLILIRNAWATLGGDRLDHDGQEWTAELVNAQIAANVALLDVVAERLDAASVDDIRSVLANFDAVVETDWHAESDVRIGTALEEFWGDEVWERLAAHRLGDDVPGGTGMILAEEETERYAEAIGWMVFGLASRGFSALDVRLPFLAPFLDVFGEEIAGEALPA